MLFRSCAYCRTGHPGRRHHAPVGCLDRLLGGTDTGWLHGVAGEPVSCRTGESVIVARQSDPVWFDHAVFGHCALRKVKVYEAFVEGAKEGFDVAKNLLPYLVAMLCAVGVLRASGALDFGLDGIRHGVEWLGWDTRFVDALPTAMVKPFSGSAARALLIETMQTQGVDSFPALVAATVQGSTETTFYVLAVYFGAVGIQRARHAVGCALLAEFAGVVAAIGVCYWFFG